MYSNFQGTLPLELMEPGEIPIETINCNNFYDIAAATHDINCF